MALEQFRTVKNPNYYLAEPTLNTPTFEGKGAALLGIKGQPISPEQFLSLFEGHLLDGETSIRLPKLIRHDRKGGTEMTVNFPKDVSILNLVGKDARIDDLIERATSKLAETIEREAEVWTGKKGDKERYSKPGNLVYVPFDHYSSREGEPHRHRHIVFMNLSFDRSSRTWKAAELGHIDQRALGETFRKEMVTGLRQLGYKVRNTERDYEIIGFPAEIKGKFSSRHHRIKELEAEYDAKAIAAGNKPMGKKERSKLSLYERPEKTIVALETRLKNWVSDLTKDQFKTVGFVVRKALSSLEQSRWADSLRNHFHKLYHSANQEHEIERVQSIRASEARSESRGGIEI